MVADRVADNAPSATHILGEGTPRPQDGVADNNSSATHTLGEGTPRPQDEVADNAPSATHKRRWQMVADGCR